MTMTPPDTQNGPQNGPPHTPTRPWLAPVVAAGLAGVILAILLIPGVLTYPEPPAVPAAPPAPDPLALAALEESNRSLEKRIASQKRLLANGICLAPEGYRLLDASYPPLSPEDRTALPPPAALTPPNTASSTTESARGSLLTLIDRSTVLVLSGNTQGTGFYVAPNLVMTNHHVIEEADALLVINPAMGVAKATVLAQSTGSDFGSPDFALLRVEPPVRASPNPQPSTALSFAPAIERLENVVAAGFPVLVTSTDDRFQQLLQGDLSTLPTPAVTEGVVTAIQSGSNISNVILHTAQVTGGNSGGPLLNRCGQVMGVNTFINTKQEGRMNYALGAADIRRFLAAHNVEAKLATGGCAPESAPVPAPAPAPAPAASPPVR